MKTRMFMVGAILSTVLPPLCGMTKWAAQYSAVSYVTVTESSHGIASPFIGVLCTDRNGNKLTLDQVSWTVDPTTFEVDISFTSSFTGTVRLSGPWPASDTANGSDFAVTIGQINSAKLNVCAQCGAYPARRSYNGSTYAASSGVSLTWLSFSATAVYVYLRENIATYGLDQSGCVVGSYSVTGAANVECGVTSMPAGVVPLASATVSGGEFTSVTDLRPW